MSQQLLQTVIVASYFSRRLPAISTGQKPGSHLVRSRFERQDQVKSLYRLWAENNQGIFFVENEEVAAADISSHPSPIRQQVSGKGGSPESDLVTLGRTEGRDPSIQ